jgi:hypothetical protein
VPRDFPHQFLLEQAPLGAQTEEDRGADTFRHLQEGEAVGEIGTHEFELLRGQAVLARLAQETVLVAHVELRGGRGGGRGGGREG